MCLGGSSANTDRKTQLATEADLTNIYKSLASQGTSIFGAGTADIGAGLADTAKASKYYSDILSGDPTKVLEAAQPQIKAANQSADQERKQLANFGNRTGGKTEAGATLSDKVRGNIVDTISGVRSGAASGLERTGADTSSVGTTLTGQGLGAETSAGGLAQGLVADSISSRKTSQDIHDAAVQQWADVVAGVLFGM